MLEGESDGNNLSTLNGLEVLGALRTSSEADQAANNTSRNASGKNQRSRGPKRESARESARESTRESAATSVAEDHDSVVGDSPGDPSPKVGPSTTASRLIGKAGSRQGSVPAGREASVKADDGAESADGVKVSASERNKLQVGTEVCYKNKAKAAEGEGILCSITNVVGEGKQRRYEIIDSDTDTPTPPTPYRASVNYLVPIPSSNLGLPDLAPGKNVLALYPMTTTFYRAEVVASKNKKDGPAELKEGFVRLRFEGEEEVGRNEDVERRYVLVA
ncbi:hypothetical protein W97_03265 [Coniosporium apollinis CBS 100218]|uniref:SGF29 C-terminal domain-containing protein n=1 Tax=Coniosporium apollinis (strain CBS 100218) TaxID=1168221 RepID=R7YQ44_CONA1|nr:uncharacterized protein W97_03265 [Coniosporium apollinis CBS 100218]EON64035.1 hypothetical protein W97_03265 [Coniosporium apollinis CBS 100218]